MNALVSLSLSPSLLDSRRLRKVSSNQQIENVEFQIKSELSRFFFLLIFQSGLILFNDIFLNRIDFEVFVLFFANATKFIQRFVTVNLTIEKK